MTLKALVIGILAALIALEALQLVEQGRGTPIVSNQSGVANSQLATEGVEYGTLIDTLGAAGAYKQFKQETLKNSSSGAQHALAHVFGEVLYEKTGLPGIVICDEAFVYGCDHSFIGAAINDRGLGIAVGLADECTKQFGDGSPCLHGIGHGLVGYLGYDKKSLLEALGYCRTISDRSSVASENACATGVFMEYNRRTMIDPSGGGTLARDWDPGEPQAPCSWVDKEFLEPCYNEVPQWWKTVFAWDFKKVGEYCLGAPEEALVRTCIGSLGYSLSSNYDFKIDPIVKACDQMPDTSWDIVCRQGAAQAFLADPGQAGHVSSLCSGLSVAEKTRCLNGIKKS
ncbi:MAG: hypothetical protein Q7S95_03615 [bacterium]|nr:hypothetical protein [bacterium]